MKKIIIIPAYNEAGSILSVVEDIKENAAGYDYVIINDASTDETVEICEKNGLRFLDLASNLGIGGAVQTGYQYAMNEGYDIAVQFDGDGQHKAECINDLEEALVNGPFDMVIGSRFIDREGFQSTGLRRAAIRYISWLINVVAGKKITDPTSGFRMCTKEIIKIFAEKYPWDYPEPETSAHLIARGYKISEVPALMRERQAGKSSIAKPLTALFYMIKVSVGIMIEGIGGRMK